MKKWVRMLLLAVTAVAAAPAAEFDVEMPRMLLRRLQLCHQCGAALLVTRVHPGTLVRCPDCGTGQPRLRDEHLVNQLYQLCSLCEMPLDSEGRKAGDVVECGNCHTRQALSPDAILADRYRAGRGHLPGFPPGRGDKLMLFLADDAEHGMAAAGLTQIPDSDPGETYAAFGVPPLPLDAPPLTRGYARPVPRPVPRPPAALSEPPARGESGSPPAVVDVPSVTVDMFGGPGLPDLPVGRPEPRGSARGADDPPLARVGGLPITRRAVDAIVLPALRALGEDATPEREDRMRQAVLDRLIQRELAAREALRLGVKPDPDEVRARAEALAARLAGTGIDPVREAEKEILMRVMRDRVAAGASVPREQVLRLYELHKDEMVRPGRLAVVPLCVFGDRKGRSDSRDHRTIAGDIARALEAGARFDEMRGKHDEFASVAGGAGTDDPLPRDYFAEEVLLAVGDLPAGAVFGPVFLPGLALFGKITAVLPPEPVPFEEAEDSLRSRLMAEEADRAFAAWMDGLAASAGIEVY